LHPRKKGLLRHNTGSGKEEREMKIPIAATAFCDFHLSRIRAFSAPYPSDALLPIKKGRESFVFVDSIFWV
jgi:hypothetical protein